MKIRVHSKASFVGAGAWSTMSRCERRVALDSARPVWTLLAISDAVSAAIVLVFRSVLPV
jgi:hypothetical protein